ncbi:hypothetical protein HO133_009456 [Letharia lupina]|uniref:Extracellular mutant protein 11 C-terminal domain-containing protein n=1 Tax=Letharia lupina TaxID=560253 RepID=A0A8H6FET0_9LECA|nr:uncharacterized protein HO133_009456 [Letharia lupina]KAF6225456.1 hypothetical protein HO133_009456 [Letharia lupina]
MAALRQLLNARGITKDATTSEEDQRRVDAKMQAMGYSISPPIPTRLRSSRSEDQGQRPFHSKFNENDFAQHPLYRGGDPNGAEHGNSFDDPSRPQLSRSATDDHLHQSYAMNDGRGGVDVSSYYEDGEQLPALSPALNKHLALRPLDPHGQQQQQHPSQTKHGRHRSRSATDDNLYYGVERENNAVSKEHRKHKPRQESLAGGSTKPLPEKRSDETMKERTMQLLRDRQQTPTQNSNGRFTPQALVVPHDEATKVAHTFSGSDGSPTDSAGNSVSNSISEGGHGKHGRKRSRDLDYGVHQLAEMDYQQLHNESFDHVPGHIPYHGLPDPSLPLSERLHNIYPDKTHKDKAARAKAFFASLTIDQYEECGDLLLDGFRDVMDRLRQARQQKRKAARAMEEQIAKREEWVRKKRGVCELELGRLRSAGTAVVKPIKSR